MKNTIYITATIVATVVGAGFATGQEIYSFFNVYGKGSLLGIVIMLFGFVFAFYTVLRYCFVRRIDSFSAFLSELLPRKFGKMIYVCVALFSFCGLCAMASATGALFLQSFKLPYFAGVFALLIICFLILIFNISGIARLNLYLTPLICLGLVYFSVRGFLFREVATFSAHYYRNILQICLSAILYVSYNILSVVVVLCSMRQYADNLRNIRLSCAGAGLILTILALMIWSVIELYADKIILGEIPLLQISARSGTVHEIIYGIILLASVLTTAVGCGYATVQFIKQSLHCQTLVAALIAVLSVVPVCYFGFSGIVRVLYTFFGFLGMPFLLILIYSQLKLMRTCKNKLKNMKNE